MDIASFLNNLEFSDDHVMINPLIDKAFTKEIRIAFKEGQMMKEHKTKFPITVMTLIGSIEFKVEDKVHILNQGDVISLEGGVLHELKATEKTVVRLSLHKRDSVARVSAVLSL